MSETPVVRAEPAYVIVENERAAATKTNVAADCKRFARLIVFTKRVSRELTPALISFIPTDRYVHYNDSWPRTIPGVSFHAGQLVKGGPRSANRC
jgi:hypothetical protein